MEIDEIKQELEDVMNLIGNCQLNTYQNQDSIFEEAKPTKDLNSIHVLHSQNSFEYSRFCLQINQDYQILVKKALEKLELIYKRNQERLEKFHREEQEINKNNRGGGTICRKKLCIYAQPYFCNIQGRFPRDNEDSIEKRKQNIVDAYVLPPRPWMSSEKKQLSQGVQMNVRDLIMDPYKKKKEILKNKLHNCSTPKEQEMINNKLDDLEKEKMNLKSMPIEQYLVIMKDKIDWMSISASCMSGRRDPEECQIMWINYLTPSINKKAFTSEEDEKLKKLSKKYSCDWEMIARHMGARRTAFQCFERYQKNINDTILNRYWTEEEDNRLMSLIDQLRIGDFIPWQRVCYHLEKRNMQQVIHRYTRTICPKLKRTPWSLEEDTMLIACVNKFGNHWNKMTDFLPGRSNYHCRERFSNTLHPDLKIGNWTTEEDNKLIKLYDKYGHGKWSKISLHFKGRTDNMCLSRATCLIKHGKLKFFKYSKDEEIEESENNVDPDFTTKSKDNKFPRTNICSYLNGKQSQIRFKAQENFVKVWKKIHGCDHEEIYFDDIDLSKENMQTLHKIKKELFKNEIESENTSWKPHYNKYEKSRYDFEDEDNHSESIDNDDDDAFIQSSDENEDTDEENEETDIKTEPTQEEENIIEKCLDNIFDTKVKCQASKCMKLIVRNEKSSAEYNIYRSLLYKDFSINSSTDDNENISFLGINYSTTIPYIKKLFVQPLVSENEFPVIAPNITTLNIIEKLLSFKSILIPSTSYVQRSKYILKNLLTDYKQEMKCFFCIIKENQEVNFMNSENEEKNYIEMRTKMDIIDEKLKENILYEANPYVQVSQFCECYKLQKLRIRFHRMRKRFASIFLWPAILSNTSLNENQQHLMNKCQTLLFKFYSKSEQKIQCKKYLNNILKQEVDSSAIQNYSLSNGENSSQSDSDVTLHSNLERKKK